MKIDREGSKLVISLPMDEDDRHDFLMEMRFIMFHGWLDKNTAVFDTSVHSIDVTAKACVIIARVAERMKFEITESAKEMLAEMRQKYEEKLDAERKAKEAEWARQRAIEKLKSGCMFCLSLKTDGNKWVCEKSGTPCFTSASEIEQLYEEWKETKVFRRPTPFPNRECPHTEVLR